MKRFFLIAALLFLGCSILFAQTDGDGFDSPASGDSESSEVTFNYHVLKKDDNLIRLNLSLSFPVRPKTLNIGGEVSIGFSHMITDFISLGGEACFSYNSTIGKNVLYFIPLLFSAGFHPTFGNLELSVMLFLGGAFENYLDRSYFGLAIKPEVGVYYKFFSDWLIGLSAGLFVLPEWHSDSSKDYISLIPEVRLGAKYTF